MNATGGLVPCPFCDSMGVCWNGNEVIIRWWYDREEWAGDNLSLGTLMKQSFQLRLCLIVFCQVGQRFR